MNHLRYVENLYSSYKNSLTITCSFFLGKFSTNISAETKSRSMRWLSNVSISVYPKHLPSNEP
jgi:hypothetical protein